MNNHPKPLSAKDKNSFAYYTVQKRLPQILGKIIDFVSRSWYGFRIKYGKDAEEDINMITTCLSRLLYQLTTNKSLEPLNDSHPDVDMWNRAFTEFSKTSPLTWFEGPWLFIEPYLYRKVNESFFKSQYLQSFDPFSEIKYQSYVNAIPVVYLICEYLYNLEEKGWENIDIEDVFHKIMKVSLWGNKFNLSLSNMTATQAIENPLQNLESLDSFIMRNDISFVYNHLKSRLDYFKHGKTEHGYQSQNSLKDKYPEKALVHFILDNSGFELFTDLILAYFLIKTNLADRIMLWGKSMPWYVSDATALDLINILNWLSEPQTVEDEYANNVENVENKEHVFNDLLVEKSKNKTDDVNESKNGDNKPNEGAKNMDRHTLRKLTKYGKWFSEKFKLLMETDKSNNKLISAIEYRNDWFWTLPYDFDRMPEVNKILYDELAEGYLLIFKGDLNFRKLIGDLDWPHTYSFRESLRRFRPAPLVAMRTNKSDLIVGLSEEMDNIACASYPKDWMISGDYAIIEFDQ